MSDDVTGYDGEQIGEMIDYHDGSGEYLGTGFVEESKGCLEMLVLLPYMGVMIYYVYQIISNQ